MPDIFDYRDPNAWLRALLSPSGSTARLITRESVAEAVGCEPTALSHLVAGRRPILPDAAIALSVIAGLDLDEADQLALLTQSDQPDHDEAIAGSVARHQARLELGAGPPLPMQIAEIDADARNLLATVRHRTALPRQAGQIAGLLQPPRPAAVLRPLPPVSTSPVFRLPPLSDPRGRVAHRAALSRIPWLTCTRPSATIETCLLVWALRPEQIPKLFERVRLRLRKLEQELLARADLPGQRQVLQIGGWLFAASEQLDGDGIIEDSGRGKPCETELAEIQSATEDKAFVGIHLYGSELMHWTSARRWLQDVQSRRWAARKLSIASLASRTGLKLGTLYAALVEARPLPLPAVDLLAKAFGFRGDYIEYLALAVEADRKRPRADIYERMAEIRLRNGVIHLDTTAFLAFTRWDYLSVCEMSACRDFRPDPAWSARRCRPRLLTSDAGAALNGLLRLGLLAADGNGVPRPTNKFMAPDGPDLPPNASNRSYWRAADRARLAVERNDEVGAEAMYVSVLVEDVPEVKATMLSIRDEMNAAFAAASAEQPTNQVFALLMHAGPASAPLPEPAPL